MTQTIDVAEYVTSFARFSLQQFCASHESEYSTAPGLVASIFV